MNTLGNLGQVNISKFGSINLRIPLTVIQLSSDHCTHKFLFNCKNQSYKSLFNCKSQSNKFLFNCKSQSNKFLFNCKSQSYNCSEVDS